MLIELENFKAEQAGRESVLRQLSELQGSTREVLNNLRELLYELRGEALAELDFVDSIERLTRRWQERSGLTVQLHVSASWPAVLRAPAAQNLYRVVEEAVRNVARHSGAKQVHVMLDLDSDGMAWVSIIDDGGGIDSDNDAGPRGLGMLGMRERVLVLGGQLRMQSWPGAGTIIDAIIPIANLV
jgi:signal transduction histidine kinase